MVQTVFGICKGKNGTETDELLQAGADVHQMFQVLEYGRVPAKEARNWRIEGQKNHKKRESEASEHVSNGRFHGPKKIMESRQRTGAAG